MLRINPEPRTEESDSFAHVTVSARTGTNIRKLGEFESVGFETIMDGVRKVIVESFNDVDELAEPDAFIIEVGRPYYKGH